MMNLATTACCAVTGTLLALQAAPSAPPASAPPASAPPASAPPAGSPTAPARPTITESPTLDAPPAVAPPASGPKAPKLAAPEAVSLFNGKNLDGWKPFLPEAGADPAKTWSVTDGVLACTGSPAGYIATTALYTSFELELEWRFDPKKGEGNSGVLLRVQEPDQVWPRSIEAQLHSKNAGDIWNIGEFAMKTAPDRTKGRRTEKARPSNEKPLGEWNSYRIVLGGSTLALWVNGEMQNVATDVAIVPGRIGLQSEGAYIEFRNIRIKVLPERAGAPAAPASPAAPAAPAAPSTK